MNFSRLNGKVALMPPHWHSICSPVHGPIGVMGKFNVREGTHI